MANNTDFLKIMITDVPLFWPRLDQPYRYNSQEGRSEACAATVTGACYSIKWEMGMAEAKDLFQVLKKHYLATRQTNAKLPDFAQVFGMKKDADTGTVYFTAKKRAVSNDGKINKPPVVIGADMKPLDDKAIWSGSRGNLRVLAFAVTDPDGRGGISLLLDVVQVVTAVYGGDNIEEDFGPVKTAASAAALDDFDDTPVTANTTAAAATTPIPEEAEF